MRSNYYLDFAGLKILDTTRQYGLVSERVPNNSDVVGEFIDTYQTKDKDIIISNPPFQRIKSYKQRKDNLKYKCLQKLLELDKPFIILMNSTNMFQKWFMELFEGKDIKFIFPSKKIQYDKYKEGGEEQIDAVFDRKDLKQQYSKQLVVFK